MAHVDRASLARNEHLTFRANTGVGRHGWLRLTPAYGVRLVRDKLATLDKGAVVTDPFSGTGTTALGAAELGLYGQSIDVNPFLVWLGNAKVARYENAVLLDTLAASAEIVSQHLRANLDADLWAPNIFKIEKWWSPGALHALKVLRAEIDQFSGQMKTLMELALCRTLISSSNAAFNHQSMSFKSAEGTLPLFEEDDYSLVLKLWIESLDTIVDSARYSLQGKASVYLGDAREFGEVLEPADYVLTSPPYVNRMSYIRELRPYMYWMRYLDVASDAGELDWQAIGGTWGTATSKLNSWEPDVETPVDEALRVVYSQISEDGGKNGPLLATYVRKYHHDMWKHFMSLALHVKPGGTVSYIIGNSTFYKHEVPAHEWYAQMLSALGYENVKVAVIRKRNSNKALFEYDVSATAPLN